MGYGDRAIAVGALQRLIDGRLGQLSMEAGEPFLAPVERFDSIPPAASLRNWVLAAALEEFEGLSPSRPSTAASRPAGAWNLSWLWDSAARRWNAACAWCSSASAPPPERRHRALRV
jgi:hypothetical protein